MRSDSPHPRRTDAEEPEGGDADTQSAIAVATAAAYDGEVAPALRAQMIC